MDLKSGKTCSSIPIYNREDGLKSGKAEHVYPALKAPQRSSSQLAMPILEDCKVYRPPDCQKLSFVCFLLLLFSSLQEKVSIQ